MQQQEGGEGGQPTSAESGEGGKGLPKELKDKLTPEEQKSLEEAIKKFIEGTKKEKEKGVSEGGKKSETGETPKQDVKEGQAQKPIDIGSLSEELKQKIKEYIESLPEDQQKELADRAKAQLKEFEDSLNKELEGKLSDDPEKKAERKEAGEEESEKAQISAGETVRTGSFPKEPVDIQ